MTYNIKKSKFMVPLLVAGGIFLLAGCGSSSDDAPATPPPSGGGPQPEPGLVTFAPNGSLSATVTWTDYGVPYVNADNLESIGFGVGYAFAQDNLCILADQIVKFNSKRAYYFGPDAIPGSGDSENLLTDFGFLTLGIRDNAEAGFSQISEQAQALLTGYAAGYNTYLNTTDVADMDPACAGQPWVQEITPIDIMTYAQGVALLPGAANFTGPLFLAVPSNQSLVMTTAGEPVALNFDVTSVGMPDPNPLELGSNGWAIGRDLSATGQGMLIANPHFPFSGNQRFWQFGVEVPGHLKVVGGSLSGMPGMVNIGFNENVAWTHTFSTASRFTIHRLTLDPEDASGTSYLLDGESVPMTTKTHEIEVATGPGTHMTLRKTSYYSEFGPLIIVPGALPWGTDATGTNVAFALYDANLPNYDIFDHWLAMNQAENIASYKQSFTQHTGTVFNNAMAVDGEGNAFFTDGSSVPHILPEALAVWAQHPLYQGMTQQAGLPIFPGDDRLFMPQGTVPFEQAPQLERTDFVQNSNDSFWLTNPAAPITGVSPLWGPVGNQQSLRSRMGQKMLAEGGSVNGLFTREDLVDRLINNRNFLAEAVLDDLLALCESNGGALVTMPDNATVDIAAGCAALAQWDGRMNVQSKGAMMFREFASEFQRNPQWEVPYDPAEPVTTPHTLAANETVLQQLARAQQRIESAGLDPAATLGSVQFVERSLVDGTPSGEKLPWGGAHNVEGGFNVFSSNMGNDGTLIPRHRYPQLAGSNLSAVGGGYHVTYGSSWMFAVEFTDAGPVAEGLLSYSQSSNRNSDHYLDQTLLYSAEPQLRPLHFSQADIEANAVRTATLTGSSLR